MREQPNQFKVWAILEARQRFRRRYVEAAIKFREQLAGEEPDLGTTEQLDDLLRVLESFIMVDRNRIRTQVAEMLVCAGPIPTADETCNSAHLFPG